MLRVRVEALASGFRFFFCGGEGGGGVVLDTIWRLSSQEASDLQHWIFQPGY